MISREFVGKVKMQSDINSFSFASSAARSGIFHEHHRADRRDPPLFVTSKGRIGFRDGAAPIVSIDDKHSIRTH